MKVVIVAAGRGSRMGQHTEARPKCLFEFAGRRLIDWQLKACAAVGLEDVTIVTGYRAESLNPLGKYTRHNPDWAITNMVMSLMCAKDVLLSGEDILVAYSDIIYEPRLLRLLGDAEGSAVTVVDRNWEALWSLRFEDPLSDAETLRMDDSGNILEIGQTPASIAEIEGQYIGLTKFSAPGAARLVEIYDGAAENTAWLNGRSREKCYFTDILTGLITEGPGLRAAVTESGWLEFDSGEDVAAYARLRDNRELERFWSSAEMAA